MDNTGKKYQRKTPYRWPRPSFEECFKHKKNGVGLAEAARLYQMPKANLHRLVTGEYGLQLERVGRTFDTELRRSDLMKKGYTQEEVQRMVLESDPHDDDDEETIYCQVDISEIAAFFRENKPLICRPWNKNLGAFL